MAIDPRVDDPDELRRLYWGEGMYQQEIADELDCSRALIVKRMQEFDIESRPRGQQTEGDLSLLNDPDWLREKYIDEDLDGNEIAEIIGCTGGGVRKRLHKYDIPVRTRGFRAGELHPEYKAEKADIYGPNWYRQRRKALDRDDHACQRCGMDNAEAKERYTKGINVHHIRPRSEFIADGVLDHERANDLQNLISLCHGCHKKWEGLPVDNREVAA